jgi:ribosomal protein S27E
MLSFFGAVWAGAVRTVPCPRCRRSQTVARRPMPFEVTCCGCRRPFRVTERGAVAVGWGEVGCPR